MCSVPKQVVAGKENEASHEMNSHFKFKLRLGFDEFQEIFVCSVPKQVVVGKEYEASHEMNSQRL